MINSDDLKYFIELAKTQHVTRASERLGISQPALSHCINRLETEMGCDLFIRSKKGVTLNANGQRLFQSSPCAGLAAALCPDCVRRSCDPE